MELLPWMPKGIIGRFLDKLPRRIGHHAGGAEVVLVVVAYGQRGVGAGVRGADIGADEEGIAGGEGSWGLRVES